MRRALVISSSRLDIQDLHGLIRIFQPTTTNTFKILIVQTSLSESNNYRHLRTATNVSTIIHISTKTPAQTRKNSPQHNFLHTTALPPPTHPQSTHRNHPLHSLSPQGGYIGSVPVRQLSWPRSTAVSPHRHTCQNVLQLLERTTAKG